MRNFGWLSNGEMVSKFENISINEVWELPTIQFLNDLSCLKMKREVEADIERKMMQKHKLNG
jgi:hypothetical protein